MEKNDFIQQGSLEWHLERVGCITASNAWKVLDRTAKGLPTAEYKNYVWQLVIERLTGRPTDSYVTPAMQWGIDNEEGARAFYSELNEVEVEEVGIVTYQKQPILKCSPDGLVNHDGLVELKCLSTRNHLEARLSGEPPHQYLIQCQFQLMVTMRDWCDLAFYDPRLPIEYQFFQYHIEADEELIKKLEEGSVALDQEVNTIINQLKEKFVWPLTTTPIAEF